MNIVLFHPACLPVRNYGGVERVVLWLAQGLAQRGHCVWVAALRGSLLPSGIKILPMEKNKISAWDLLPLLPPETDVVHFMAPPEEGVLAKLKCSYLVTIHGNGRSGETFPLNTVFISHNHASRHHSEVFVYNGVDPAEFDFSPLEKSDEFLFLSKTHLRTKNVRGAIRMAQASGAQLRVAGGHRPWLERLRTVYDKRIRWEGSVGGPRKSALLSRAKGFVFPILWDEPFGLVVIEALISGTPVLANPRGSLPELVSPEVGALVKNEDEWRHWLSQKTLPWKPETCRKWALEKFNFNRMAEDYEGLYKRVNQGENLNAQPPYV